MGLRSRTIRKFVNSDTIIKLVSLASGQKQSAIRKLRDKAMLPRQAVDHLGLVIDAMSTRGKLVFVQVGANDGKTDDPIFESIFKHADRALLIEPQPWLIDTLEQNYSEFRGQLVIENVAISSVPGELGLYVLRKEYWDEYIANVGRHPSAIFSPDPNQILSRVAPRLRMSENKAKEAIERISVPSKRLDALLKHHGFLNADVVQIDCEGWDFEVIQSMREVRPPVINFESINLSNQVWKQFLEWAEANNYGYIRAASDTLAIRGLAQRIDL
jgi:FkbM family methyltransferase